jgi:hypothetical protein
LVSDRRDAAKEIADENRRGLNGDTCEALILIQNAIEAIDRAIADEGRGRSSSAGVSMRIIDAPGGA